MLESILIGLLSLLLLELELNLISLLVLVARENLDLAVADAARQAEGLELLERQALLLEFLIRVY